MAAFNPALSASTEANRLMRASNPHRPGPAIAPTLGPNRA
jgi:hypothetical protein